MPKLIADGRSPISPSQLYWKRLGTLNNYLSAVRRNDAAGTEFWKIEMAKYWDQWVDTGIGVAVHPDQGAILIPNAKQLRELNLDTQLSDGDRYIILPDGAFNSLKGKGYHYTAAKIEEYGNRQLSEDGAKKSPFLEDFIPDKELRGMAVAVNFRQFRERFKLVGELMGTYFPDAPKGQEIMGLFGFGWLEDGSISCGSYHLGNFKCGRLVGVFPDVAEGDVQNLEDILIKYPELRKAA
ncbi:hypothetical protein HYU13_05940 [Candidatus Woesearchaeota archaeon]|nr:hypothetical protein [Candidatus Woesearchaeota archaeon]